MAKNGFRSAQSENDKPVDRRKKRKFVIQPSKKKGETELKQAQRHLAEADQIIQDAEASVMRFSEELYMLQQSFGEKEKIVSEARRLLDVAQSRLGAAVMNKQKALEIVGKHRSRRKK